MASQTADNAPTSGDVVAALTDMINSGAKQMATFVRASQPLLDAYAGYVKTQIDDTQAAYEFLVARGRLDQVSANALQGAACH